ncbi:Periplasmic dipeptide transport protein [Methylobacterium crusticola]|uniref:Periplasmic dipeptide transport protein n=1 Tax=Methylobacterium crusticola TaxID=1697972 RepID=A0ABQ4R709_9HYPH|nr:ABC transporter substrate-binding protein [Methylobacterium crusticola]GJD52537.1 Periplasmic dipeptide transport protein [Methylobacterium crusticola]
MRNRLTIASVLASGALAAWSAAVAAPLRIQVPADIRSLDPGVNRDNNTDGVVLHMVEGLVAYGEDATPKPLLAERVDVSPDGLSYTFRLRRGVKFHNGADLTSADVLWSWNRYMDPRTDWRCLSDFDGRGSVKVTSVTAPDAASVVFSLEKPTALFLTALSRTDCGMTGILHRDSVRADGSFDRPVGTGPFKFGAWKRGEFVRLDRFADYAALPGKRDGYTGAKRPLVDEVRFLVVPDPATARTGVMSGAIDIMPDLDSSAMTELKDDKRADLSVIPNMGLVGLIMQTRDPVLGNVTLRRAVAAAIDKPEIVAAATEGFGKPNGSVVPTLSSYHGKVQDEDIAYDPAAARALVAASGYRGETIVMLATKRYPSSFNTAVVSQQMLRAVGLKVEIEVLEWATQLDRYAKGTYQMQAFPYSGRMDPSLSYETIAGPKDRQPRKLWDDPGVQALVDRSMVVSERAERQAIFDALHRRFLADVPMVMLFNGIASGAAGAEVRGYASSPTALPRLWEVSRAPAPPPADPKGPTCSVSP